MKTEQEIKDFCKENVEAHKLAVAYMESCENEFVEQDELAFNSFIEGYKQDQPKWTDVNEIPKEGTEKVYTLDDDGSLGLFYVNDNWLTEATEQGIVKWCYTPPLP